MQPPWTFGARHAAVSDHSFDMISPAAAMSAARFFTTALLQFPPSGNPVFKNHRLPITQVSEGIVVGCQCTPFPFLAVLQPELPPCGWSQLVARAQATEG